MKRRDFLKVMLGSAAAVVVAPRILAADRYPGFDPRKHYGDFVTAHENLTVKGKWRREVVEIIDQSIEGAIPPEYRDRIRYIAGRPGNSVDPLMQVYTYGWRYDPREAA